MTAERRNFRLGLFGYAVIYILAKFFQSERLYFRPALYLKAPFKTQGSESGGWGSQSALKPTWQIQIKRRALAAKQVKVEKLHGLLFHARSAL